MNEKTVEIKELFDSLFLCEKQLTNGQLEFLTGCKKKHKKTGELSDKQLAVLREIRKFIPGDQVRYSGAEISQASGMTTEG